jgi:hypothetical protein
MKTKVNILSVLFILSLGSGLQAQIKVKSNGKVGVGENNPSQRLHVTDVSSHWIQAKIKN